MNFTVHKHQLDAVNVVARAAQRKEDGLALVGIQIEVTEDGAIILTATDLQIGIQAEIKDLMQCEPGTAFVNANNLSNLIKQLPDDKPITFTLDEQGNKLKISYGKSSTSLNLLNSDDFPGVQIADTSPIATFDAVELVGAVHKTVFACAANHFKPVFTGVLFDLKEDGGFTLVGSDTHRLSIVRVNTIMARIDEPAQFILPVNAVNEVARMFKDSKDIQMSLSGSVVVFTSENGYKLVCRLIEGIYPNYRQVVPASLVATLAVNAETFTESVNRAVVISADSGLKIQSVRLSTEGNELVMTSQSDKRGEITEVVDVEQASENFEGQINFNAKYLKQVSDIMAGQSTVIRIGLSGSRSPAVLSFPGSDKFIHVLTPLTSGGKKEE